MLFRSCSYEDSKVLDSRPTNEGTAIRRRRECLRCKKRFTTYEKIEETPLIVVKKNGDRETFDRSKILKGVIKSCEKRPVSLSQIEGLADSVEEKLMSTMKKEVSSTEVGELIMQGLKEIDQVAYVRFASVYREFKDTQSFMKELQKIIDEQNN